MAFESKHTNLLQAYADKFGLPTTGDEDARIWTRKLAEQFAFSFPGEGWGTKRADANRPPSTDVICRIENGVLIGYDTVISAGVPSASLSPHPHPEVLTGQVFIPVSPVDHLKSSSGGGETPKHSCLLGVSFFCALGLIRKDHARYRQQMDWFRDVLRPNYARIFWYLAEGPWGIVGTERVSASERQQLLRQACEDLLAIGVRPQVTVFGTAVHDAGRAGELIDQFVDAFRPYGPRSFLVDAVNEPGAIGYTPGSYGPTREIARRLAAANLGVPYLAAASPDSLHMSDNSAVEADTCKLMDGLPAAVNAITPHYLRSPWTPHRNMGRCAVGKAILNDEPRGYRSSISAIDNPADFAKDYASSAKAGEIGYTFHTEPGVWMGYCDAIRPDWDDNNKYKRIQDLPGIDAIVNALHQVRDTGNVGGGGGGTVPPKPSDLKPVNDDVLLDIANEFRARNRLDDGGGLVDSGSQFGRRIQAGYSVERAFYETVEWITSWYGPRPDGQVPPKPTDSAPSTPLVPVPDDDLVALSEEVRNRTTEDIGAMVDAGSQYGRRVQSGINREEALRQTREVIEQWFGPRK